MVSSPEWAEWLVLLTLAGQDSGGTAGNPVYNAVLPVISRFFRKLPDIHLANAP